MLAQTHLVQAHLVRLIKRPVVDEPRVFEPGGGKDTDGALRGPERRSEGLSIPDRYIVTLNSAVLSCCSAQASTASAASPSCQRSSAACSVAASLGA